jgi:hypothetical protein
MNSKRIDQIERQIAELRQMAMTVYGEPAPTMADLEAKRDARIYKETWESLTPQQQKQFTQQQGTAATLRKLAQQAQQLADSEWEQSQLVEQGKQEDSNRWAGWTGARSQLPGADYDQLIRNAEQLEAKRAERVQARKQREIAAEAWDTEQERIANSLDDHERKIFMQLLNDQPRPLEALQSFVQSQTPNPIADIADSYRLYELGAEREGIGTNDTKPEPANDSEALYNQALKDLRKGDL